MNGPFVFIARAALLPEALGAETAHTPTLTESLKTNEPQLLGFNVFVNETATEVASVQIYQDAAAMEDHMRISAEQLALAYNTTRGAATHIELYGQPTTAITAMLARLQAAGANVSIFPRFLGGFLRRTPGSADIVDRTAEASDD